jgi:23S rRNA (adenine2503-C2)-methyltransferase
LVTIQKRWKNDSNATTMTSQLTAASHLPRLYEVSRTDLAHWCAQHGLPAYRIDQCHRWIFRNRASSFLEMHDLPASLRGVLAEHFALFPSTVVRHQVSVDRTEKLLLQLTDGEFVECVLMREGCVAAEDDGIAQRPAAAVERGRNKPGGTARGDSRRRTTIREHAVAAPRRTVCLSTQVGCGMGCVFCASGLRGWKRNLTTGEILEQVLRLDRLLASDERITNIVVMGIGEPLANLHALLPALDRLCDHDALGLSARRITISTVGLPEKIIELAEHGKPYNLAVSLHAPHDALRNRLVPVNARIGLTAIFAAADEYFRKTGRRVTFEYVLLSGVNDGPEEARELGRVLRSRIAHVNLIPMNGVTELPFVEPSPPRTAAFARILRQAGIPVTVRKRKGADIDAACGQLRLQQLDGAHPQRPGISAVDVDGGEGSRVDEEAVGR